MRDKKEGTCTGKGRHLCPRLVQQVAEVKTSYELSWEVKRDNIKTETKQREYQITEYFPAFASGTTAATLLILLQLYCYCRSLYLNTSYVLCSVFLYIYRYCCMEDGFTFDEQKKRTYE